MREFNLVSKLNKLVWGKGLQQKCVVYFFLSFLLSTCSSPWNPSETSIIEQIFIIRLSFVSYFSFAGNGNLTALSPHTARSLQSFPNPLQYSLLETYFSFLNYLNKCSNTTWSFWHFLINISYMQISCLTNSFYCRICFLTRTAVHVLPWEIVVPL